jgi:hypothetical protein
MANPLSLFAYLQINWNGKPVFIFKAFFLENKTSKSNVVKLHLNSGEPVSYAMNTNLSSAFFCAQQTL